MIAGGGEIYKHFISTYEQIRIHLSVIHGKYDCDTYLDRFDGFVVKSREVREGYDYLVLEKGDVDELQYIHLLRDVLDNGDVREGRNGEVRSVFSRSMRFDLRRGFPLLTTKKMFLRGIIEELLFFIRGDTDTTSLANIGVNIWNGNTTPSFIEDRGLPYAKGVMGPMYGYQWRSYNRPYKIDEDGRPVLHNDSDAGIDQIKQVVDLIRTDPTSRRILMTTYNPIQAEEGVLYPCHSIVNQFYVRDDELDMSCYNRSQDLFLGTPYNIASSSILLMIVAKLTNKRPGIFTLMMGDTHLYETHLKQAVTQATRIPFESPRLELVGKIHDIADLANLSFEDFKLSSYSSYPSIKAIMST
jgi:thymidylate synthase